MPPPLSKLELKLNARLSTLDAAFDRLIITPTLNNRVDIFALQEGLASALWQVWCHFCRTLALHSARGTVTQDGTVVTSPYIANTDEEVAFVCHRLAHRRPIGKIVPLGGNHLEPTWGDVGKYGTLVVGLGTTNSSTVNSAVSSAIRLRDLQICRNSCAHITADNIAKIKSLQVRYLDTSFNHPSDMLAWTDPNTKDFLWKSWIDEMRAVANLAIGP